MPYNTIIVLTGISLLGMCSGLVGGFAVLRGRALVGDALAHAALPGVCLAFLIVGERNLPAMLFGGFLSGLAGVAVIAGLVLVRRIREDAAIGIVLSVFYGAGIALMQYILTHSAGGSRAGLQTYFLGQTAAMLRQDVYLVGGVALVCLTLVLLMYKEFKLNVFDPDFASVQGWPSVRIDLILMTMIALTVIISLPAVGLVLTAAMLIIPAAASRFWTEGLGRMLVLSAVLGMAVGVGGALITARVNLPSGPVIILLGTAVFLASVLFAPRRGFIARLTSQRRFRRRLAEQNVLRRIHIAAGKSNAPDDNQFETEFGPVVDRLHADGFLQARDDSGIQLTPEGRTRAERISRSYELWKTFLTENPESASQFDNFDFEAV